MLSLSPDALAILLPLGILFTSLLIFGTGFAWARYRDRCSGQVFLATEL